MQFREQRYPCDFPAVLALPGAESGVMVVNISAHGARVARAGAAVPGARAELAMMGVRFPATVQWARQGRAGLRFDTALPAAVLARARHALRVEGREVGWTLLRGGRG